jgi:hypothetical protein
MQEDRYLHEKSPLLLNIRREKELVMIATGDNYNLGFFNLVDKAMFTVDPAGPATGKLKT